MPAVKYDYDYYNQYGKSSKDVARNARSYQSSSNAQRSKTSVRRTPESTRNSTRMATRGVASPKTKSNVKVNLQKPVEMKLNRPKVKPKAKAKTEGVKRNILLGMIIVTFLFIICMRYTQINEKFNEVSSLEKEMASTEALNQQLTSSIESKTDLNYIEKYAKYQLGMQKPTESQIVRIAYEKQDKISTPVVIEEEDEESFLEKLYNDLKNLID